MTVPAHSRRDAPTRTPTLLRRHYFLDRYLVLIGAILVSITPGMGPSAFAEDTGVERYENEICGFTGGCGDVTREPLPDSTYRFIEGHPLEIYAEIVVAYLTTPAIAYPLLACGALAVFLQWRTGK